MLKFASLQRNDTTLVVAIHKMKHIAGVRRYPNQVVGRAVARHNTNPCSLLRLPRQRRLPRHRPIHTARQRHYREQDVIVCYYKIMNHRGVRRLKCVRLSDKTLPRHLM